MKNIQEISEGLQSSQRLRLLALFGSRRALLWEEGDDELKGLRLIHIRRSEQGAETAELNNHGWAVAMSLGQ